MIHDRLPFLDLPDGAFLGHGVDTGLIHRGRGGQQVGRVIARVVEGFDLRSEGLAILVLGPTSPTEGVGPRQAAEILGMQLQRSALQGMSAQLTSRLLRVVIFGGG